MLHMIFTIPKANRLITPDTYIFNRGLQSRQAELLL